LSEFGDQPQVPLSAARHRIANVFQLLTTLSRLRAQRGDSAEARRQVEWVGDSITALGVLQRRALGDGGDDFAGFLEEMAPHWRRRAAGRAVSLDLDVEPLSVPEQTAAALAVIVQELVANALAHGFPPPRGGAVRVGLKPLGGERGLLSVADDGIGYVPGPPDPHRLGLWLITGLADQVGGALNVASDDGVVAKLEFPLR
jgi:two-component sensor histidine kinase